MIYRKTGQAVRYCTGIRRFYIYMIVPYLNSNVSTTALYSTGTWYHSSARLVHAHCAADGIMEVMAAGIAAACDISGCRHQCRNVVESKLIAIIIITPT